MQKKSIKKTITKNNTFKEELMNASYDTLELFLQQLESMIVLEWKRFKSLTTKYVINIFREIQIKKNI